MFSVLADDLTGAAELAGIGLKFGLNVEIISEFSGSSDAELLVINSRSRSLNKKEAFLRMMDATKFGLTLNPEWLYKKTDSVLRGNILEEINAVLEVSGLKKCLLIPANPGLGRTIVNRKYLIDNQDIMKTSFINDPDFRSKSSDVMDLLGESERLETTYLKEYQKLPGSGIFIGELSNDNAMDHWVEQVDKLVLPAGAAEFFTKILLKKGHTFRKLQDHQIQDYGKTLFICGSAHQNSRDAVNIAKKDGARICYMPEKLAFQHDNNLLEKWHWDINISLKKSNKAILVTPNRNFTSVEDTGRIKKVFGQVTALLLLGMKLDTLIIEGGETAQEITKRLKINHFFPKNLLAPGVVELQTKIENPSTVILKPGSYLWPQSLWHFN